MTWRLAPCLAVAADELRALYGDLRIDTIGDPAHSSRVSDHNPDPWRYVRALDVFAALRSGEAVPAVDLRRIAETFRTLGAAGDRRLRGGYVIHDGRIASDVAEWAWRRYTGPNPHATHVHVSAADDPNDYRIGLGWSLARLLEGRDVEADAGPVLSAPAAPVFDDYRDKVTPGERVVELYSAGDDVVWLQRKLGGLGDDGLAGPATIAAVRDYQRRKGLDVDGIVGPNTWAELLPDRTVGDTGAIVRLLQRRAGELEVDGQYGWKTRDRVRALQLAHGLDADGIVGRMTWRVLL